MAVFLLPSRLFVKIEFALFPKKIVQNSDQVKKKDVFLAQKLTQLEHFTVYLSMFSMKISQILNINL